MNQKTEQTRIWRIKELDNILTMRACFKNFAFSNHFHDEYAIGLVEHGIQCFKQRGITYHIPAGSLFTVNPGDVHDGRSGWDHAYRYTTIFIPVSLMRELNGTDRDLLFAKPVFKDTEAARAVKQLLDSCESNSSDSLELHTRLYGLITYLFTHHSDASPPGTMRNPHPAVTRGCEYIDDMAGQHISLEDIARNAGLSRYHFLRVFKQHMGLSPSHYLNNRRLHLARQAIDRGNSLADAAVSSGFCDQSHLNNRFKSSFGLTPRQYQQAITG